MNSVRFNHSSLNFDIDKLMAFDNLNVSTTEEYHLEYPFVIEVNDSSYFYASRKDRDADFIKLKKCIKYNH